MRDSGWGWFVLAVLGWSADWLFMDHVVPRVLQTMRDFGVTLPGLTMQAVLLWERKSIRPTVLAAQAWSAKLSGLTSWPRLQWCSFVASLLVLAWYVLAMVMPMIKLSIELGRRR